MPRMKYYNEDTKQWEDADSAGGGAAGGKAGGYYLPSVTQPEPGVLQIGFTPSAEGMPPVPPTVVELPGGGMPDDTEQLALLIETDMLPAVHDGNGAILTDEHGNIILRY